MSQNKKSRVTFLELDDAGSDNSSDDKAINETRRVTRSTTKRWKRDEMKEDQPQTLGSGETGDVKSRKPWETIVLGVDLGDNLSYIEEKDREILQRRYIIEHYEKESPGQVAHHKWLLDELIQERAEMEDDEENHLPADEREARSRVIERVETLNWALDTCECEAEAVNIRAALQGYASGEIGYSDNFTLIYGGHIVDVCPTYQSFCVDRSERLRRYADKYGEGWLWSEPPLAGPAFEVLAKKGLSLDRETSSSFGIGHYAVHLNFMVDKRKVMREGRRPTKDISDDTSSQSDSQSGSHPDEVRAHLKTLLDSGATVPMLHPNDLQQLKIDMKWYSAQGVVGTNTANGKTKNRYYEMYVSVCTEDGSSIVGQGNSVTWPNEPSTLGGFLPVIIAGSRRRGKQVTYTDRLSGLLPFDASYVSSAPTTGRIWLGEDRRDVLGASRFPGHLRYDGDKVLTIPYPQRLDGIRVGTETPDAVVFAHHLKNSPGSQFIDTDRPGKRGTSEWAIKRARHQRGARLTLVTEETAEIKPPVGTPVTRNAEWRKRNWTLAQIRAYNKANSKT
ncbi:hypothetical protein SLS62_000331 [Diatrype stigma]|uniref:Uncharacterized protein n=1 Tax=Diatrype stigma TaxID=117547 RepID=A0AAN9YT04_9PEZI